MNTTGKKARKSTGLNRLGIHREFHSRKSNEKRQRMGTAWVATRKKG